MTGENDEEREDEEESDDLGGEEGPRYERHIVQYDVGQRRILLHVGHAVVHHGQHERRPQARDEHVHDAHERLALLALERAQRMVAAAHAQAVNASATGACSVRAVRRVVRVRRVVELFETILAKVGQIVVVVMLVAVVALCLGLDEAFVELLLVGHDRQLELCCALRQIEHTCACVPLASLLCRRVGVEHLAALELAHRLADQTLMQLRVCLRTRRAATAAAAVGRRGHICTRRVVHVAIVVGVLSLLNALAHAWTIARLRSHLVVVIQARLVGRDAVAVNMMMMMMPVVDVTRLVVAVAIVAVVGVNLAAIVHAVGNVCQVYIFVKSVLVVRLLVHLIFIFVFVIIVVIVVVVVVVVAKIGEKAARLFGALVHQRVVADLHDANEMEEILSMADVVLDDLLDVALVEHEERAAVDLMLAKVGLALAVALELQPPDSRVHTPLGQVHYV